MLPLKDLLINRKLELDCDLEGLKILFSELGIEGALKIIDTLQPIESVPTEQIIARES